MNDTNRRDFYLKKAECILHHLREKPDAHFCPRKDVYLTIRIERKKGKTSEKKDKITEYDLFKGHEPDIVLVSPILMENLETLGSTFQRLVASFSDFDSNGYDHLSYTCFARKR